METIQGNRVIAEFDGYVFKPNDTLNGIKGVFRKKGKLSMLPADLKYHTSWDWLMPVVQKIEWLDSKDIDCRVTIERQECRIYFDNGIKKYERLNGGMPKIQTVWLSIIEFINWYNKNKQS